MSAFISGWLEWQLNQCNVHIQTNSISTTTTKTKNYCNIFVFISAFVLPQIFELFAKEKKSVEKHAVQIMHFFFSHLNLVLNSMNREMYMKFQSSKKTNTSGNYLGIFHRSQWTRANNYSSLWHFHAVDSKLIHSNVSTPIFIFTAFK